MTSFSNKKVPRVCVWCGRKFLAIQRWKKTARACSKSCAAYLSNSRPEVRAKMRMAWELKRKPKKHRRCGVCRKWFIPKSSKDQRFCGHSCSAKWRNALPHIKKLCIKVLRKARKMNAGRPNLFASIRMLLDNPAWRPEVAEKIRKKNLGRKLVARGGNGKLTVAQVKLSKALKLPTEFSIPTMAIAKKFERVPPKYGVDIADEKSKTAIEVDGMAHRTARIKALDLKKTEVLAALGWSVIRFTNENILEDLRGVVREVRSHIRSKGK